MLNSHRIYTFKKHLSYGIDVLWTSQQKPSVRQLWQKCWTADPYGSRWMRLTTALNYSTFIASKKILFPKRGAREVGGQRRYILECNSFVVVLFKFNGFIERGDRFFKSS